MLIELHGTPGGRSPEAYAEAAVAAGLDGVVVTDHERVDRVGRYVEALEAAGLKAFAGVELGLKAGVVVLIPRDPGDAAFAEASWKPEGEYCKSSDARSRAYELGGALIAGHPYCRELGNVLGDRVYTVKGLDGVEVRVGQGRLSWDRLADHAASKANAARLGGCGGDVERLGAAATVFDDGIEDQKELVGALVAGECLPLEIEDPANPRDREPPPPPAPREPRGGRDRERGGRGGRGDRDRGGRGDRERGGRRGGPRRRD